MARTQQETKFVQPVVVPKPIDLSKVDFSHASLFDLALLARVESLEKLLASKNEEAKSSEDNEPAK